MTGTIFYETLRRSWRQVIYWGLGLGLYAIYPFLLMPDQAGLEEYVDLLEGMNAGMLKAFGISDAALISTPEGFVGYSYFGFLLLILGVFAVIAGLNVSANEEDAGILDMFMSLPVPRWQIIVEKLLAYSVMVVAISMIGFVGLLIGDALSPQPVDIATSRYLEGSFNLIPGTLLIMTFTAFVATVVKRKSVATAIAGVFVVLSYLVDAVGRAAGGEVADAVRELSVFAHYDGTTILQSGLVVSSVVALLLIALALAGGTVAFFERRDIAT